ncbi:nitroreductase family protein [Streptomyces sp. NPDC052051]|uniref:nitroreductase family protein n=1 Tax=Streptomyces sp. NPDC052051 TaxID=3154649 RepID=UPI003426BFFD
MNSARLDVATLETLVSAAVAAPSIHPTRPWRFRLDPDTVTLEIRAVPYGGPRPADPAGRAPHLAAGCAVLNLRVAVAHFGWEPVTRLLPRPEEPDLLATVRIVGGDGDVPAPGLYDALWRRHSSRFPFSGRPLPRAVLGELAAAARAEGALLSRPTPKETERLLELAEADHHISTDSDPAARSRVSAPEPLAPRGCRDRLPQRPAHRYPAAVPARPLLAVVTTADDGRIDWLRAGQALQRVLLVATAHGLRTSLLHQALDRPDPGARLRPGSCGAGHAQMVLRLGYGPEGPPSPRRAAQEAGTGRGHRAVSRPPTPPAHTTPTASRSPRGARPA